MARDRTFDHGLGVATADGSNTGGPTLEGGDVNGAGDCTAQSTIMRSGRGALQCASGGSNLAARVSLTITSSAEMYWREYVQLGAFPGSTVAIMNMVASSTAIIQCRVTALGELQLWNAVAGSQIGSLSAALVTGTWYRVELYCKISATVGAAELRLKDATVASGSSLNTGSANLTKLGLGWEAAPGATKSIYFDDGAVNNTSGGSQNSWPGSGRVVTLLPTSDSARAAGWLDGGGVSTNLWDAVNNTPPAGAATPASGTQIKNAASSATDDYDAVMQTYEALGVNLWDTITLVQAVAAHGKASTGDKSGAITVVRNPVQSGEDSFTYSLGVGVSLAWGASAAANWGANWGTAQYAPAVTRNDPSVVRVGKRTATTDEVWVGLMALMVEYVPGSLLAGPSQTFTSNGTWTCPPGVFWAQVTCRGGGGGGSTMTSSGGGGGGGGGEYRAAVVAVTPGTGYAVVVPSAAAAGADGGDVTFNSTSIVAKGGKGVAGNTATGGLGGTGGAGTLTNFDGGVGGLGLAGTGAGGGGEGGGSTATGGAGAAGASGGAGGSGTDGGNGGAGKQSPQGDGTAGTASGGGGGGGYRTSSGTRTGGAGAIGQCVVNWVDPFILRPSQAMRSLLPQ